MSNDATEKLIGEIVERIRGVDGIIGIALGGSRARGTQTATSDIDLGIYYRRNHPLDLFKLGVIATELDDSHRGGLLTPIGGWGPWINGGGWLRIRDIPVDFLYRDLDRVSEEIDECTAGRIEVAYQPGHPHAFTSAIYMGEIAVCRVLNDPHGALEELKRKTIPFPPGLKRALVERFAWEADFSLQIAHKGIDRGDVTYAAGASFRAVACMLQVLFAVNEQYWLNEKGALALAATFPRVPQRLQVRVEKAFAELAANPGAISGAVAALEGVWREGAAIIQTG